MLHTACDECYTRHVDECYTQNVDECYTRHVDECYTPHVDECYTRHVDECYTPHVDECYTCHVDECYTRHVDECYTPHVMSVTHSMWQGNAVIVKSLPPVLYGKYSTRHKAEMANIARGEAECYVSIEAEYFIFRIARGKAMI